MSSRGRSRSPRPLSVDDDVNMLDTRSKSDLKVATVKNLSRNVVESHLKVVFGYYGEISKIDLPLYAKSGQNRGKASIVFVDSSAASQAASHMNGGILDGVIVTVVVSDTPIRSRSRSPPSRGYRGGPFFRNGRPTRSRSRTRSPRRGERLSPSRYSNNRGRYRGGRGQPTLRRSRAPYRPRSRSAGSRTRSLLRRGRRRSSPSYERGGTDYYDRRGRSRSIERSRTRSGSSSSLRSNRSRTRSWTRSRSRSRTRSYTPYSSRSHSRARTPRRRSWSRDDIRDSRSRSLTPAN